MTYRNQLAEVLARVDGVIVEARSHVKEPEDTSEMLRAAYLLVDMERLRFEVEGKSRGDA